MTSESRHPEILALVLLVLALGVTGERRASRGDISLRPDAHAQPFTSIWEAKSSRFFQKLRQKLAPLDEGWDPAGIPLIFR